MRISLHHRANAEEDPPVGIYSCAIINGTTSIILQKMYVGVYPIGKGKTIHYFRICYTILLNWVNRPAIYFIHNLQPFDNSSDLCI